MPKNGEPNSSVGPASPRSAIVLGGARSLYDDMRAAAELFTPDLVMATNNAGITHPTVFDYWVTFHPDKFPDWILKRERAGLPMPKRLCTAHHRRETIKAKLPIPMKFINGWGGSSGLMGVTLALGLGCSRVVLAGVPLDKRACHFDDERLWSEADKYRGAWVNHLPEMRGKVKSFGGWTAGQLGAPTREWLES